MGSFGSYVMDALLWIAIGLMVVAIFTHGGDRS